MHKQISFAGRRLRLKTKIMINLQDTFLNLVKGIAPGSKMQSILHKISQKVVGGYPYVMKLDVSDRCNLKCKMCYAKNKNHDVSLDNIKCILKQIGNVPIRLDLLGGEPLLRNDICEIISYAKNHTGIREIVLYTNGTLATEELAKNLFKAGLDKAIVTLISHDPKKHNDFTGLPNGWQRTITGINNFVNAGIKTYTFSALHSENIMDMEEIYKFSSNQLHVTPLFYQYIPQKKDDPLFPSLDQWHKTKHKILYEYCTEHADYFKKIINYCGQTCLGGSYSISIKADGSVTPCPFIHDLSFGNVFKQNIWDIFSKRYNSTQFSEFIKLPKDCVGCTYKNICNGGCRAGNKLLFGNYSTKDCRCLGPCKDTIKSEDILDKVPTFF
jgi:radical SAM protein with 4Fe4S-binding SPASM domain